jgi:hypothetical protein
VPEQGCIVNRLKSPKKCRNSDDCLKEFFPAIPKKSFMELRTKAQFQEIWSLYEYPLFTADEKSWIMLFNHQEAVERPL